MPYNNDTKGNAMNAMYACYSSNYSLSDANDYSRCHAYSQCDELIHARSEIKWQLKS